MKQKFHLMASSGTETGILKRIKEFYASDKTFVLSARPDGKSFDVLKEGQPLRGDVFVEKVRDRYRFGYLYTK
ncbi:MAG: hypothetical protein AAGU19_07940 [Prolixibacteraceae bacterium]